MWRWGRDCKATVPRLLSRDTSRGAADDDAARDDDGTDDATDDAGGEEARGEEDRRRADALSRGSARGVQGRTVTRTGGPSPVGPPNETDGPPVNRSS